MFVATLGLILAAAPGLAATPAAGARSAPAAVSTVDRDEHVILFPAYAWRTADGRAWETVIHGWIFEPRDGALARALPKLLVRLKLGRSPRGAERDVLDSRAGYFMVDNERGERIVCRIGAQEFHLPRSQPNGHFFLSIRFDHEAVEQIAGPGGALRKVVRCRVVLPASDPRQFSTNIELLEPEGVSVISDIDDTLRMSAVGDREELLRKTFLEPFEPVPGMAAVYQRWAGTGAAFHYVSCGPWQLYHPLAAFLDSVGCPAGSFHLRIFRLKDHSLEEFSGPPELHKRPAIETILRRFPRRQFVLVGDSGECDPEIYASLARAHPRQIVRIFVRNSGDHRLRFERAFADIPRDLWQVFTNSDQLPSHPAGMTAAVPSRRNFR